MITATTALFVRTLRVETRVFRGYGMRLLLGGLVLFILAAMQSTALGRSAAGLDLIRIIVWSAFACITLGGLSGFCSAITEEKEEGTLGLMRLAGLDPVAILLGKSTARLWEALLLAGTMLPFATLAVTLGGVSLTQVLACAVALAAYVFMLANLGLLCSVLMRTSQAAASMMTLALIALLLAPSLMSAVPPPAGAWHALWLVAGWVDGGSIVHRLNHVLMTGYGEGLTDRQTWIDLAIGLGGFGLAWLAFDRFAGGDADTAPARAVIRRRSRLNVLGLPRPRPGLAALAWKDFHFSCGGRLLLAVKLVLAAALGTWLIWLSRESSHGVRDAGEGSMVIAMLWIGIETGAHLSRIYANEVRGQTLDGIIGLPYGTAAIAYTKLRALPPTLLPALAFFVVGAALAPRSFVDGLGALFEKPMVGLATIAAVLYFWHACAWLSLVLRRGALAAAILLMLVTWLALGMGLSVLAYLFSGMDAAGGALATAAPMIAASVYMHFATGRRLRARAAG